MTTQGIILEGDVGDGTPAVVAWHIDAVEEQIGLDGQQLTTLIAFHPRFGLLRYGNDDRRVHHLRHFLHHDGLRGGLALADDDHAGCTQRGEVGDEDTVPDASAVEAPQRFLQLGILLPGHILVEEALHAVIVGIASLKHALAKVLVVLRLCLDLQTVAFGYLQVILHVVEQRFLAVLTKNLVERLRPFG